MSRYLLDTTTLIDFAKGREPSRSRLLAMLEEPDAQVGVCAVTLAEFYAGLPPESRAIWDDFIGELVFWNITSHAAVRAGGYRYQYARQGRSLSTADCLIAATAIEHTAIVVTDNTKDYPMPEARLLTLRSTL